MRRLPCGKKKARSKEESKKESKKRRRNRSRSWLRVSYFVTQCFRREKTGLSPRCPYAVKDRETMPKSFRSASREFRRAELVYLMVYQCLRAVFTGIFKSANRTFPSRRGFFSICRSSEEDRGPRFRGSSKLCRRPPFLRFRGFRAKNAPPPRESAAILRSIAGQ